MRTNERDNVAIVANDGGLRAGAALPSGLVLVDRMPQGHEGTIGDGRASIEAVGWELFRVMLDLASGRRKTRAEQWKLHNAPVLFNPAPVT